SRRGAARLGRGPTRDLTCRYRPHQGSPCIRDQTDCTNPGGNVMSAEAQAATSAAEITARLDRLPMTRHIWMMVVLIALGASFENYDIFFTGYVAPGLFEAKIFSATTTGLFGTTGLASFIAALFTGLFIGTLVFAVVADRFGRRTVFTFAAVWYSI